MIHIGLAINIPIELSVWNTRSTTTRRYEGYDASDIEEFTDDEVEYFGIVWEIWKWSIWSCDADMDKPGDVFHGPCLTAKYSYRTLALLPEGTIFRCEGVHDWIVRSGLPVEQEAERIRSLPNDVF